ncbi:hypothetical protein PFICI_10796 [Pestalotiopsis fici W106-1]|uniref:PDZ domain-containing protein n=1 Tax=Pestalotiopsis fici (strain W106-1 / CGMCC3.15140) TaxID=1229662 RepID=W3WUW0_PESFW|nr:uncharacterized protein PFICI_10796 [Pestalotiopsis fici W106-1]ETS76922.1 hypothetical protein PFICI_10796 [Pestalotiopsis fici W106-1]
MSETSETSIGYVITPVFDGEEVAQALNVQVTFTGSAALKCDDVFLATPVEIAKVDVGRFDLTSISAHDSLGQLDLIHHVDSYGPPIVFQKWRVPRPTEGPITMNYTALPRLVNSSTMNAPSFELRQQFGGLLGSGYGFLATPPATNHQLHRVTVSWDLTAAPPGTASIWTFGDGSDPVTRVMDVNEIAGTYFMVGKLESFVKDRFGLYWLGSPPIDTTQLGSELFKMFDRMSSFFRDGVDPYRVFLRYNPFPGSMAGTALVRSFMFSYDDDDRKHPRPFKDYLLFLSHECVHNWVHLDPAGADNWYEEGLAEYYSLLLSRRAALFSNDLFRDELNKRLTQYYTNPLVNKSNEEVAKLTWEFSDAQRIPYGRGLLFALKVNAIIEAQGKPGVSTSLDDVVLSLVDLERAQQLNGLSDYLKAVGDRIAGGQEEAQKLYDEMASGVLVIPPADSLKSYGLTLRRRDALAWELGFDESKAIKGERIVSNVVPGSAAASCGLQEGDRIVNKIHLDDQKADENRVLDLTVQRGDGEVLYFSFLPRGQQTVERWVYESNDSKDTNSGNNVEI